MESDACPTFRAEKTMLTTVPDVPTYPGFGTPPLNRTSPDAFEKLGCSTHNENIEFDEDTEVTCRCSGE
jgi:hypothetical protein